MGIGIHVDALIWRFTYSDGSEVRTVEAHGLKWVDHDQHGGVIVIIDDREQFIPWPWIMEGPTHVPGERAEVDPIEGALRWVRATFPVLRDLVPDQRKPDSATATPRLVVVLRLQNSRARLTFIAWL